MKSLLHLVLIMFSVVILASDLATNKDEANKIKLEVTEFGTEFKTEAETIDIKKIDNIVLEIKNEIINFYSLLPKIEGRIMSLPKAGTIGIKFNEDKISIHEGMKLVAKRQGIDKPLIGKGILYLKYNKYNKLVGKYTRSQVGKFEINDLVKSKWYKPSIVIASFNDKQELASLIRNTLITNHKNNYTLNLKNNKKINMILNKISTIKNTNREMKKLFGLGVDYFVSGSLEDDNKVINLNILSTYTNKIIFNIKVNTKL